MGGGDLERSVPVCLYCSRGAEWHFAYNLSIMRTAIDMRWSDGLPVTLDKSEEVPIVRDLFD